ncbi:MAG: hypothetical protein ACRDEA_03785, partial [Microcystaceae cyanobacterium]
MQNPEDRDKLSKARVEYEETPKAESKAIKFLREHSGRTEFDGKNAYRHFRQGENNDENQTYFLKSEDPRVKALFDYWEFVDLIGFKGGRKAFSGMHFEMSEFNTHPQVRQCNSQRRRLNLVPRGHLKSTQNTVGMSLWRIYRNSNIRICVDTATRDLALQFVREIKQYFEDEELQEKVWNNRPHIPGRLIPILDKAGFSRRNQRWNLGDWTESTDKKIVWRADAIQVMRSDMMKEPTILAASPGSNITGMHFDLIIMDDIINDDTVATPEKIEKTLRQIQDLESVLDPQRVVSIGKVGEEKIVETIGDEQIVNGTRYAKDDYYGYLIENLEYLDYKLFFRNLYVNGQDNGDGYIWQEKFNDSHVDMLKKRIGAIRFASQYLNKVIASEEIILQLDMIQHFRPDYCDLSQRGLVRVRTWNNEDQKEEYTDVRPYLVIDPAISQKKTADYSVILVGGLDFARNLYIFDFKCGRFLPDTLIEMTYELVEKWKLVAVHVEVVSFQQALVYMFKQTIK